MIYVELNTRREIPYLQATLYLFVYYINTIAFYCKEKSSLLTNENKRIDNPRIKIVKCVGANAQDEKNALNHYENNTGRNFQCTKFLVIDLVLADRRNLSRTQPHRLVAKILFFYNTIPLK